MKQNRRKFDSIYEDTFEINNNKTSNQVMDVKIYDK